MKLTQHMTNVIRPVIRLGGYIAAAAMMAIMLVTVLDVFLRYVFNRPLLGTIEITEYLMVVLCFLAIAFCALDRGHVTVDLVVQGLKRTWQTFYEILGYLLCLVLYVPMTFIYIPEAIDVQRGGEESEILGIPASPFYVVVIIGCALVTIVLLIELFNSIQRLKEK